MQSIMGRAWASSGMWHGWVTTVYVNYNSPNSKRRHSLGFGWKRATKCEGCPSLPSKSHGIPLYHGYTWDCPWESTVPLEDSHIPLSVLSHCTMGQVGLSMGSPLSHMRILISHCPSYPTVPWDRWDCPWESTVPHEDPHIPLSLLSYCTMGQVGLSMGVHCPTWGPPYPTVHPIPLHHGTGGTVHGSPTVAPEDPHIPLSVLSYCTMGQVGLSMGVHCPTWGPPYPTVHPIPLYHGTGGTVHGSPLSHLRTLISHCLSYPTVPWDRWDCPWESTVPPEDPHIPLSVLSYCTMGQVGLSMGVHCPTWGPPYPTVCPIPLYHGTGGTVHGSPLSHLRTLISHCLSYPTVPWDRWDCPWESTVPHEDPHIPLSVLSHCTMGQVGLSMGVHCPTWWASYPTVCPISLHYMCILEATVSP